MYIKDELLKYKDIVEKYLDSVLPNDDGLQNKIYESMRYSVFAGGKRLRPFLTLKVCEIVNGNYEKALPFASAIEIIHTYSLIHDDLPCMDDDDLRRGKPTNHKVFGEGMAVLAGDGLLNFAYELMISQAVKNINESDKYLKAMSEIANSSGIYGMIGGQVVDIISENTKVGENVLNFIHNHKTSALIEASIVSGGILGGADEDEIKALRSYGKAIGLGFQIRDDILDKIGDIQELGKDIGSDEDNNKVTYISLFGLEGAIKKSKELCETAKKSLAVIDKAGVNILEQLADYLTYREK